MNIKQVIYKALSTACTAAINWLTVNPEEYVGKLGNGLVLVGIHKEKSNSKIIIFDAEEHLGNYVYQCVKVHDEDFKNITGPLQVHTSTVNNYYFYEDDEPDFEEWYSTYDDKCPASFEINYLGMTKDVVEKAIEPDIRLVTARLSYNDYDPIQIWCESVLTNFAGYEVIGYYIDIDTFAVNIKPTPSADEKRLIDSRESLDNRIRKMLRSRYK